MENAPTTTPDLAALCGKYSPQEGSNPTGIEGLVVYRRSHKTPPGNAMYTRRLFIVAQGCKRAMMGDEIFEYDPENYLTISVPLPVVSEILEATPERPFLSIALDFRVELVRDVVVRGGAQFQQLETPETQRGLAVSRLSPKMKSATLRLMSLLETPEDAPVLAEMYIREILYYVLKGPQGSFLRAMAMGGGHQHAIADVLANIHQNCAKEVVVAELAASAGMSETVFYEAFRAVTASSPIQYIKRLRLLEAHHHLTAGFMNVSEAAYSVGYNSISQFSREFKRVFGATPSSYVRT